MPSSLYYFDGLKALKLPLGPTDANSWLRSPFTPAGTISPEEAYSTVPHVHRAVELRAHVLSNIPFVIYRGDDPYEWNLADRLPHLLYLVESSLCIHGTAYIYPQYNALGMPVDLQWVSSRTMVPIYDLNYGLLRFDRYTGTEVRPLPPEEVLYFWEPNSLFEMGPGPSAVMAALVPATMARRAGDFGISFFQRGAIPAVILTTDGNPDDRELRRVELWWKKLLQGVGRAWETIAVRGGLKPMIIQPPLQELALLDVHNLAVRQILAALGVQSTLVEEAANRATAREHRRSFMMETIIPEANLIENTINRQFFSKIGLKFAFQYNMIESMQRDLADLGPALATLVQNGIMDKQTAQVQLGLARDPSTGAADVPDAAVAGPPAAGSPTPASGPAPQQPNSRDAIAQARSLDLTRWLKMCRKAARAGEPMPASFKSQWIEPDLLSHISHELVRDGTTAEEVEKIFSQAEGDS